MRPGDPGAVVCFSRATLSGGSGGGNGGASALHLAAELFNVRAGTQMVHVPFKGSGPALAAALQAGVYLVKPSLRELQDLTGHPLTEPADQLAACRQLIRSGQAQVVALTLGADGALLVSAEQAWRAQALRVPVASTIGAGDSFVGGMVWSLANSDAPEVAFRWGMAAGAASLLMPGTALCQASDVQRLVHAVELTRL